MAATKIDISLNIAPLPGASETAPAPRRSPAPAFSFAADDDSGPELAVLSASRQVASPIEAIPGIDLSDRKKIVFWIGRGKTGKTTGITGRPKRQSSPGLRCSWRIWTRPTTHFPSTSTMLPARPRRRTLPSP